MLSLKRKMIVVAVVLWLGSALGGGVWGQLENYWLTRSIPPGEMEVENLKALYGARLYDEVIGECDRAEHDPRCAGYGPQIMYIRWATDRRLNKAAEAKRDQELFLNRYPDNPLAADIHFSMAMNLLADADYAGADGELKVIDLRFPKTSAAEKARDILSRLTKARAATRPLK